MVNFELVIDMVNTICQGDITKGMSFNDFCIKFYLETRALPLSKFLKMRGYANKMPKIMNTRKAGEVLFESKGRKEIEEIIQKAGYKEVPQLSYSALMVLRKVSLEKNWERIIAYLKGQGTIDEILKLNKKLILPEERSKIIEYAQQELNLSSNEMQWFIDMYKKVNTNKKLLNSLNKLL